MIAELKETLGIRDSMRLFAAADITRIFGPLGEFSRSEVVRELSGVYGNKCLDRAIADLEAGGVLAVNQVRKQDVSAGASYFVAAPTAWGNRDPQKLHDRKLRHGRGGCR